MTESPAERATLEVLWSVWTELGAPGPFRRHAEDLVDPEWTIVATPALAARDPRLSSLAFSWCAEHGDRVLATRVRALAERVPEALRPATEGFLAELASAGVKWTTAPARPITHERRAVELPLARPALWRLRVRALAGVGGRAEVLAALLVRAREWVDAASLADVGVTKRAVAQILSELADAEILLPRARGNAREFRLRDPRSLAALTGYPVDPRPTPWGAWFSAALLVSALEALPRGSATRRVELARRWPELAALAVDLGVELPRAPSEAALVALVSREATVAAEPPSGPWGAS